MNNKLILTITFLMILGFLMYFCGDDDTEPVGDPTTTTPVETTTTTIGNTTSTITTTLTSTYIQTTTLDNYDSDIICYMTSGTNLVAFDAIKVDAYASGVNMIPQSDISNSSSIYFLDHAEKYPVDDRYHYRGNNIAISPDNRYIAYSIKKEIQTSNSFQISNYLHVFDVNTTSDTEIDVIRSSTPLSFGVEPTSGNLYLYYVDQVPYPTLTGGGLHRYNVTTNPGTSELILSNNPGPSTGTLYDTPVVSPDGSKLYYMQAEYSQQGTSPNEYWDANITLKVTSTNVAVPNPSNDITIANITTKSRVNLVKLPFERAYWSEDSSQILVTEIEMQSGETLWKLFEADGSTAGSPTDVTSSNKPAGTAIFAWIPYNQGSENNLIFYTHGTDNIQNLLKSPLIASQNSTQVYKIDDSRVESFGYDAHGNVYVVSNGGAALIGDNLTKITDE